MGVSPGCFSSLSQFTVSPLSLGGVPVFSLPYLKGSFLSFLASLLLGGSPALPPGFCSNPVCIIPPKKVPVVKITLSPFILSPLLKHTPFILFFSRIKSSTEPSFVFRPFVFSINSCIAFL